MTQIQELRGVYRDERKQMRADMEAMKMKIGQASLSSPEKKKLKKDLREAYKIQRTEARLEHKKLKLEAQGLKIREALVGL
jgi:hypothetical protein